MPNVAPSKFIEALVSKIENKRSKVEKGKLIYSEPDRKKLAAVTSQLKALPAQMEASSAGIKDYQEAIKRIMDTAYFSAYVEGRTKSGIGKTAKSPLLKLYEDTIFPEAIEVLIAQGEATQGDNFLMPDTKKDSFEKALAMTVTDPAVIKNIFEDAISNINLAWRYAEPTTKEGKAKYTNEEKNAYNGALQNYANAMKLAERFSIEGKSQFNKLLSDTLGEKAADILKVTTKSRGEEDLKKLLKDVAKDPNAAQKIILHIEKQRLGTKTTYGEDRAASPSESKSTSPTESKSSDVRPSQSQKSAASDVPPPPSNEVPTPPPAPPVVRAATPPTPPPLPTRAKSESVAEAPPPAPAMTSSASAPPAPPMTSSASVPPAPPMAPSGDVPTAPAMTASSSAPAAPEAPQPSKGGMFKPASGGRSDLLSSIQQGAKLRKVNKDGDSATPSAISPRGSESSNQSGNRTPSLQDSVKEGLQARGIRNAVDSDSEDEDWDIDDDKTPKHGR